MFMEAVVDGNCENGFTAQTTGSREGLATQFYSGPLNADRK